MLTRRLPLIDLPRICAAYLEAQNTGSPALRMWNHFSWDVHVLIVYPAGQIFRCVRTPHRVSSLRNSWYIHFGLPRALQDTVKAGLAARRRIPLWVEWQKWLAAGQNFPPWLRVPYSELQLPREISVALADEFLPAALDYLEETDNPCLEHARRCTTPITLLHTCLAGPNPWACTWKDDFALVSWCEKPLAERIAHLLKDTDEFVLDRKADADHEP